MFISKVISFVDSKSEDESPMHNSAMKTYRRVDIMVWHRNNFL
jgi:hypothetical protein